MKITPVSDLSHFVELVGSDFSRGHVFRGVSELENHPLIPTIGRFSPESNWTLPRITSEERSMLKRFKLEAAPYVSGASSDLEWLVIARHHGLPVRLLDWSRNPLVALYFAVQGDNRHSGGVYVERFTRSVTERDRLNPFGLKQVAKINPVHANARISAQASLLTIHPDPRVPYTSRSLVCLRISGKLKRDLKLSLRSFGIHPASMFPGPDGVAENIVSWRG